MSEAEMRAKTMALVDILLSVPDEISLDEVCDDVKYDLGIADDREVKRLTLETVHEMLRRGARVDFDGGVEGRRNTRRRHRTQSSRVSTANGMHSASCRATLAKSASSNGLPPPWRHSRKDQPCLVAVAAANEVAALHRRVGTANAAGSYDASLRSTKSSRSWPQKISLSIMKDGAPKMPWWIAKLV